MVYVVAQNQKDKKVYLSYLGTKGTTQYTEDIDKAYCYESRNRAHDMLVKLGKHKKDVNHTIVEVEG